MSSAQPSCAHNALASLVRDGCVSRLITQNVDRLHTKAGCDGVIELHGSVYDVRCRSCGALETRSSVHARAEAENAAWLTETRAALKGRRQAGGEGEGVGARPDGDFDVNNNAELFLPPPCKACGERSLTPDVVFFGGSLVPAVAERAAETIDSADALLVAGTTLSTLSALRLVRSAALRKAPVIILNKGVTRADGIAGVVRYDVDVGETLKGAAAELQREFPGR
jgi:NAD-dependent deacetylase sirtuin 4